MPHEAGHMRAVLAAMEGAPEDVGKVIQAAVMAGLTSNPDGGGPLPGETLGGFLTRLWGGLPRDWPVPPEVLARVIGPPPREEV